MHQENISRSSQKKKNRLTAVQWMSYLHLRLTRILWFCFEANVLSNQAINHFLNTTEKAHGPEMFTL